MVVASSAPVDCDTVILDRAEVKSGIIGLFVDPDLDSFVLVSLFGIGLEVVALRFKVLVDGGEYKPSAELCLCWGMGVEEAGKEALVPAPAIVALFSFFLVFWLSLLVTSDGITLEPEDIVVSKALCNGCVVASTVGVVTDFSFILKIMGFSVVVTLISSPLAVDFIVLFITIVDCAFSTPFSGICDNSEDTVPSGSDFD